MPQRQIILLVLFLILELLFWLGSGFMMVGDRFLFLFFFFFCCSVVLLFCCKIVLLLLVTCYLLLINY